jgi:formylglycine-generating enzyme required for sulfatase activity
MIRDARTGIVFRLVEPGSFTMGSENPVHESPPHEVQITRPFCLGVMEVTVGRWQSFAQSLGYVSDAESGEGGWTVNGVLDPSIP